MSNNENLILEIHPKEGMDNIKFGTQIEKVLTLIGTPDETTNLDNDDDDVTTVVCNYWEKGCSLFFEGEDNPLFTCADIDNRNINLFGRKIFNLNKKEIISLMGANGFINPETEEEVWGETRLSYPDAVIDFYFEGGELNSVSWGADMDKKGEYIFYK
jgi:hypothetical protein